MSSAAIEAPKKSLGDAFRHVKRVMQGAVERDALEQLKEIVAFRTRLEARYWATIRKCGEIRQADESGERVSEHEFSRDPDPDQVEAICTARARSEEAQRIANILLYELQRIGIIDVRTAEAFPDWKQVVLDAVAHRLAVARTRYESELKSAQERLRGEGLDSEGIAKIPRVADAKRAVDRFERITRELKTADETAVWRMHVPDLLSE